MKKTNVLSVVFFLFSILAILFMAQFPLYHEHLETDIPYYFERASSFVQYGNVAHLVGNEYQPGAILFFILLSPSIVLGGFTFFKTALIASNVLLLLVHGFIYLKARGYTNLLLFALSILFIGPVLLFRFDKVVTLFVVLAILLWQKNKHTWSVILFGVGTLIKVYPIIFIPYLLLLEWRNNGIKKAVQLLVVYILSLLIPLCFYIFVLQGSIPEMYSSLDYHALKPVGLESVWATIIVIVNFLQKGIYPQIVTSGGIWGIDTAGVPLPLWFYNYFWLIPFLILHLCLFRVVKKGTALDVRVLVCNLLIFLTVSKVIAPQYIVWLLTLVPLMPYPSRKRERYLLFCLAVLIPGLYQIIYPLNYTAWLNSFASGTGNVWLFAFNTIRNFLLVSVCLLFGYTVFNTSAKK